MTERHLNPGMSTMSQHMKPRDNAEFRTVSPETVLVGQSATSNASEELARSVLRHGVLVPVLVGQETDGRLTVVAGRRRVLAARAAGRPLPVRVLTGDRLDWLLKAFNEDSCRSERSIVERGEQTREIVEEARTRGIQPTRRWLADVAGVSVGTAHNLMTVGENLSRERIESLAAMVGVDADAIRRLPVRKAMRLAAEEDDIAAADLLKKFAAPPDSVEPRPVRIWLRLFDRIIRFILALWSMLTPGR